MSKTRIAAKSFCFLISLMVICIGCVGGSRSVKPTRQPSLSPIERRDFLAGVDDVWAATLQTVKMSGGSIIVKDRNSRRIMYSLFHTPSRQRVELTVLLKDLTPEYGMDTTAVFLGLRGWRPGGYSTVADDFFKTLDKNLLRH